MKKKLSLIFLLFLSLSNAQSKGSFKICQDITIHMITFNKSIGNHYIKRPIGNELIELCFILEEQPKKKLKCFLIQRTVDDLAADKYTNGSKQEVDLSYFYELIEKLNKIDSKTISEDSNVADGSTCSIEITGENVAIRLSDNWETESKAEFYNLFESVWNQFKN